MSSLIRMSCAFGLLFLVTACCCGHPTTHTARARQYEVIDLGANTPAGSLVEQAKSTDGLIAIGLAATTPDNDETIAATLNTLAAAVAVPVVLGGAALRDDEHGRTLGPCIRSSSPRHALELFDEFRLAATAEG